MFNEISNRNLSYNTAANKNPISLLKIRMFGLRGWSLELENENKLLPPSSRKTRGHKWLLCPKLNKRCIICI